VYGSVLQQTPAWTLGVSLIAVPGVAGIENGFTIHLVERPADAGALRTRKQADKHAAVAAGSTLQLLHALQDTSHHLTKLMCVSAY
jgi:hypothetical protein